MAWDVFVERQVRSGFQLYILEIIAFDSVAYVVFSVFDFDEDDSVVCFAGFGVVLNDHVTDLRDIGFSEVPSFGILHEILTV